MPADQGQNETSPKPVTGEHGAEKYIGAHPPAFSPEAALHIAQSAFGVTGTLRPLWGERDQNFAIHADGGPSHVLKVSNVREQPQELDLQLRTLLWLETTAPDLPVPRLRRTLDDQMTTTVAGDGADQHSGSHTVHCITLLDGMQFGDVASGPAALEAAGAQAGQAAAAMSGLFHPMAGHALFWDVRHLAAFAHHAPKIHGAALARSVQAEIERFQSHTLPALAPLRAQLIHHDTNPSNVLVDPDRPERMTGLVDFGDTLHGPIALDAAVAAIEMATDSTNCIEAAAAVLAGYDRTMPLEVAEIDLIPDLMIARAVLGLLIGVTRVEHGITSTVDMDYYDMYAPALDQMLMRGTDALRDQFRAACRFPRYTPLHPVSRTDSAARTQALLDRRYAALGRHLPLTYDTPLHTEKGQGAWLFDINGRAHLDCYNNVAHVGHCHPHVVRTISRQAAALNTNARYLFEPVVDYAERLGQKLPGDLGACLFVNSGSEAVDLALRMARSVTGQSGILAIEGAYHGITVESDAISPGNDFGIPAAMNRAHVSVTRPDIEMLMNPDVLRGPYKTDDPDAAERYAADADRAIARLTEAGHPPGSFTMDSAFSTHGILDVPNGYIRSVARRVRAAGGLIIADEVQYGFGRCGSDFWGFQHHGITPDIVTLGKPIGNGIAIGCVVTTPDILARFSESYEFFSTFGGNPVACAAAGAVLDVIERDELQANAQETGTYLIEGLRNLTQEHACIGQVRGRGLFVGVDIVTDKASMTADGKRCSAIKNHLRNNGILVSSDGSGENILKIRPPMVFTRENADMLINGVQQAAAET
ncbi:MAG: aminotransferase class III-fold pyridoxal phosphate-dependent enzyme [Roseovarius sp.]